MPNTTNFNWNTPADTDLVKDGAAAIRTLGNNIDASLVDLKGGTTGQVLAKATNADLDFTWTDGGDITSVAAGVGISGGGTSGAVTITNSMATAIDAKGDLIAGTGADAFARLAVGSNDQILLCDSSTATGLRWATQTSPGTNFTNLATAAPANGTTSYSFSSISNQESLFLRWSTQGNTATLTRPSMLINGANIDTYTIFGQTWFLHTGTLANSAAGGWTPGIPYVNNVTDTTNILVIRGCKTTGFKQLTYYATGATSSNATQSIFSYGQWIMETPAAAITSVGFNLSSGFLNASFRIYGSGN